MHCCIFVIVHLFKSYFQTGTNTACADAAQLRDYGAVRKMLVVYNHYIDKLFVFMVFSQPY